MTLFDVDSVPLRTPRKGVTGGVSKPVWSDYKVKTPKCCDHCVETAYETLQEGRPLANVIRDARRKRRQDGKNLLLCHEHAQIQAAKDEKALEEAA